MYVYVSTITSIMYQLDICCASLTTTLYELVANCPQANSSTFTGLEISTNGDETRIFSKKEYKENDR